MICLVCNNKTYFYFKKLFLKQDNTFFNDRPVEYFRCDNCGFVFSKTHYQMSETTWEKLNKYYHNKTRKPRYKKLGNPPPYYEQAMMIFVLRKNHLIKTEDIIDWGGGFATLSKIMHKYFGLTIPVYDKYIADSSTAIQYISEGKLTQHKTVICSAVFEHLRKRKDLDLINQCVSDDGCLILHTVVCENIPRDPKWFYLLPVHCSFFTNKSMKIIMKQYGYQSSIYCHPAKSWVLFKKDKRDIPSLVCNINNEFKCVYLVYKKGFVDYWK